VRIGTDAAFDATYDEITRRIDLLAPERTAEPPLVTSSR
jgi:hypothetical protein